MATQVDSDGAAPGPGAGREPAVIPVALLVSSARLILERHLGLLWVSGEISNFTRATSGHCYFNLKDSAAQVRCVFFRNKAQFTDFVLKDGLAVEVRATASIYESRGEFQLNVETVRLAGIGALHERFERLKASLAAAGWFAQARKRALPPYPRAIGIVTSVRAAALSDILSTLRRRWPAPKIIVYAAAVQGDGAAGEIARQIANANARAEVDVLIVARGGGSIEDLWAFNEESVARAVFESTLPVVSGVGHETDFTICDFVADARAPTPTGAAALVTPDRRAVLASVAALARRWQRAHLRRLETNIQRVDDLTRRLVHPAAKLVAQRREFTRLAQRLDRAARSRIWTLTIAIREQGRRLAWLARQPRPQSARLAPLRRGLLGAMGTLVARSNTRLAALELGLAHLNPRSVLERGYAIVTTDQGAIVYDAAVLTAGDKVVVAFGRGSAEAKITQRE